eukprot:CAMPEP_0172319490 /NCGR_PEP_ID=MMETSP1058-20130122/37808_1 /TAXON_ID=83371 /ORGANISM="Detonula confervacea, Strain CCMP 353" /LENGTH=78 /DNA_ID=CAMNT_0013034543 /DNA_START=16 /DNA_END=249 /DNA_ORIENTATION=+
MAMKTKHSIGIGNTQQTNQEKTMTTLRIKTNQEQNPSLRNLANNPNDSSKCGTSSLAPCQKSRNSISSANTMSTCSSW